MSDLKAELFKFRYDFDRSAQIALCAKSIEGIRQHLGKDWHELCKPAASRNLRLREARNLVKHLIRVASESADFYRTVDFITHPVAVTVDAARLEHKKLKSLAGHLAPSAAVTHEHMVPGEQVLLELVRAPAHMELARVLEPLTYRALVCKRTEIGQLDAQDLRSSLPPLENTRLATRFDNLESVPSSFKALMRYDVTELINGVIPITDRAKVLKRAYLNCGPQSGIHLSNDGM